MEKEKLTDVPLHQIQIKDAFWDKYIRLVKDVILPYQWNTLNDNVKMRRQATVSRTLRSLQARQREILKELSFRIPMLQSG